LPYKELDKNEEYSIGPFCFHLREDGSFYIFSKSNLTIHPQSMNAVLIKGKSKNKEKKKK
jgi:hypothetical protein